MAGVKLPLAHPADRARSFRRRFLPTARKGSQFTFILILLLLVPFYLNQAFAADPNSLLTTGLSLFPLTAPTAMLARMSVVAVPMWQIAVSVVGLTVTTYLFVLVSPRFLLRGHAAFQRQPELGAHRCRAAQKATCSAALKLVNSNFANVSCATCDARRHGSGLPSFRLGLFLGNPCYAAVSP